MNTFFFQFVQLSFFLELEWTSFSLFPRGALCWQGRQQSESQVFCHHVHTSDTLTLADENLCQDYRQKGKG